MGGFLDACTFVGYGGVFANAQAGNVVLPGVDAQAGRWREALLHLPPAAAFMPGVALAQLLSLPAVRAVVRRPARWALIAEIAVLAAVGATPSWIPGGVVTGAVAFVPAAQISTFRSLEGTGYSTTMTTANLRTMITKIFEWRAGREPASRQQAALLAWIITAFGAGAGIGGLCTRLLHQRAAWIAAPGLIAVLAVVVIETRRLDRRQDTTRERPSD